MTGARDHQQLDVGAGQLGLQIFSAIERDQFILLAVDDQRGQANGTNLGVVSRGEGPSRGTLSQPSTIEQAADICGATLDDQARVVKISGLRPSSRSVPLKDSTSPFSQGLPGSMTSGVTPRRWSQLRTALAVNSGALSERREAGGPRCTKWGGGGGGGGVDSGSLAVAHLFYMERRPDLRTFQSLDDGTRAVKDGRVSAVISTEDSARDGAIIRTAGWDLSAFMRNPVVLYCHSDSPGGLGDGGPTSGLPIARSSRPQIDGKRVSASAEFDMDDEFAVRLLGKIQRGFVNATSVRWRPLQVSRETKKIDGEDRELVVFERQELLEWSFVSIPADPKALIARADGGAFCVDDFCDHSSTTEPIAFTLDLSTPPDETQQKLDELRAELHSARQAAW